MENKTETFIKPYLKSDLPDIRPGDTIKVYQKIKETVEKKKGSNKKENKERIQVFQGLVLVRKHGKEIGATITVRKVVDGIGVEKTFPIHSPNIEKIEVLRRGKVRRAKLYYLKDAKGKKARLKSKPIPAAEVSEDKPSPIETADKEINPEEKETAEEKQNEIKTEKKIEEKTEKSKKDEKIEEKL